MTLWRSRARIRGCEEMLAERAAGALRLRSGQARSRTRHDAGPIARVVNGRRSAMDPAKSPTLTHRGWGTRKSEGESKKQIPLGAARSLLNAVLKHGATLKSLKSVHVADQR